MLVMTLGNEVLFPMDQLFSQTSSWTPSIRTVPVDSNLIMKPAGQSSEDIACLALWCIA